MNSPYHDISMPAEAAKAYTLQAATVHNFNNSLRFMNNRNELIGELYWGGPKLCFRGEIDESAQKFMEYLCRSMNAYMSYQIKQEAGKS